MAKQATTKKPAAPPPNIWSSGGEDVPILTKPRKTRATGKKK